MKASRYSIIDAMEVEVAQADIFSDACYAANKHAPASVIVRSLNAVVYSTGGWRSMETAPKDQRILLCLDGQDWSIGQWCKDIYPPDWCDDTIDVPARFNLKPTHWQPLPELPS